jgi:hypothetical protein
MKAVRARGAMWTQFKPVTGKQATLAMERHGRVVDQAAVKERCDRCREKVLRFLGRIRTSRHLAGALGLVYDARFRSTLTKLMNDQGLPSDTWLLPLIEGAGLAPLDD